MKLIIRIAGRRSYRKFYTVDKSLSFHINSGHGEDWKGHEGLKLPGGGDPKVAQLQRKCRAEDCNGGQRGLSMGQMKTRRNAYFNQV